MAELFHRRITDFQCPSAPSVGPCHQNVNLAGLLQDFNLMSFQRHGFMDLHGTLLSLRVSSVCKQHPCQTKSRHSLGEY